MPGTALVTGGNRGIGLAIAKGLVKQGLDVVIGSRDLQAGEKAARKIGASAVQLDLGDRSSIGRAADSIGPVDVLVNNAGVLNSGRIQDDPEGFEEAMAVMVHGPYHLSRLLLPQMVRQNYGRIVNVSSGWGAFSDGVPGPGAYGVAKAGLNALTVALARNLPPNVQVNAMCPGWVRTRMGGMVAINSPEQGADTAIWLATMDQKGMTGGFYRHRKQIDW